ncbi:thymidylate kinase isoform X3 [Canna indica]|uniref:Thymidylate kinase n=1 Tax=Canna indica TaxID=4628 RepID=A0AAQ3KE95_9LILI|nr:thymidylate kinase isoform X3 [Canna indica]
MLPSAVRPNSVPRALATDPNAVAIRGGRIAAPPVGAAARTAGVHWNFGLRHLTHKKTFSCRSIRSSFTQIEMDNVHDKSRGSLIVLEGLDRSGKTSQSNRLVSYLKEKGVLVESWRFPDRTTSTGQMISAYLANESQLDDRAIHLLFSANRWEKRSLMESKIMCGTTLIVDRYSYSGVAFSAAKGLDFQWCKAPEVGLIAPDLVIYFDISPEKAAERGGYGTERYEKLEFQKKVAEHYSTLRDASWKIVDACLPMDIVEEQVREFAMACILTCQKGKPLNKLWSPDSFAL